jgi:hypothetical protein
MPRGLALSQQTITAALDAVAPIAAAADAHDLTTVTDHCDAVADLWIKDGKMLDYIGDLVTIVNPSKLRGRAFDLIQRSFVQGMALGIAATRRQVLKQKLPSRRKRRRRSQK